MKDVRQAVRALRLALGDTQQAFAHRVGMAISSVVRYEISRPPQGKALAMLTLLAAEEGCDREAVILRDALESEIGLQIVWPPREPSLSQQAPASGPKSPQLGADTSEMQEES